MNYNKINILSEDIINIIIDFKFGECEICRKICSFEKLSRYINLYVIEENEEYIEDIIEADHLKEKYVKKYFYDTICYICINKLINKRNQKYYILYP